MIKKAMLAIMALLIVTFLPGQRVAFGAAEFAHGIVQRVTDSGITISQHDYSKKEDVEIDYKITDRMKFRNMNIQSIDEIQKGDKVNIDFVGTGNDKKIESIYVFKDKRSIKKS